MVETGAAERVKTEGGGVLLSGGPRTTEDCRSKTDKRTNKPGDGRTRSWSPLRCCSELRNLEKHRPQGARGQF